MPEITPILAATIGGVLPTLAWLWFWLREDAKHPEPRMLIALAFVTGMFAVAIVLPLQRYSALNLAGPLAALFPLLGFETVKFLLWSTIEEITKFTLAGITVLKRREDNEPIDPVIYMVTVALGFAAAENVLFLLSPLAGESLQQMILVGNFRFVGANLLHVLASSAIGVSLGLAFYKPLSIKRLYVASGVILAIVLHCLFNFLILNTAEEHMFRTFGLVWIGLIVLIGMLEYIKRINPAIRRRFVKE